MKLSVQHVKILTGFFAGTFSGFIGHHVFQKEDIHIEYEEGNRSRDTRENDILKYGTPQRFPEVEVYTNHALHYDQARKIPLWVAEHITAHHVKGTANRKHSKFRPDPRVPDQFTATNKDYWHSGWSRGHMAPAADNKFDQEAMNDSFYLSNVLPQDLNNNGDFWNRMEMYCRDLTKRYASVRIISGPLVLSTAGEDGKKYVKYQVIGDNEVAVPTHLYKIILVESEEGEPQAIASFVVPNQPIPRDHSLSLYQVNLQYIENKSGFQFLPNLSRDNVKDLCKEDGCKIMSYAELELYFIRRKLESSNTLERLDKVWKEMEQKNLKPDTYAQELYDRKKQELLNKKSDL